MIKKEEIEELLKGYNPSKITIGTLCSHSALQIFHGAKKEGFKTFGIVSRERKDTYDAFPLAAPDSCLVVDDFAEVLDEKNQEMLRKNNVVIVPHGSFVEYVGPKNLEEKFYVPMFGNRKVLEWEGDREKQRKWLEGAGLKMPRAYKPKEIDGKVFVKLHGAKGGAGFFTVSSIEELEKELGKRGLKEKEITIQEFVSGARYYPHYFYSVFEAGGLKAGGGRLEMLGVDKRIEPIDESYRGLPNVPEEFFDYTVTGNQPVILRESLLPEVLKMGVSVVAASIKMFDPGMIGPFSLETIYHPKRGFTVFEISARIVAGTNLYPEGSPYSAYIFEEQMSMGRRIAREIRVGIKRGALERVLF